MMSKGWDEVGYLKRSQVLLLKRPTKILQKLKNLCKILWMLTLVFIGQLELYLHNEEDIIAPTEEP